MKTPFAILSSQIRLTLNQGRGKEGSEDFSADIWWNKDRLKEQADRPKTSLLWLSCFIVQ